MRIILFAVLCLLSSQFLLAQENSGGKISGYMFGDYFYNAVRDTGISSLSNVENGGKKDLNGIQFRRIYFTYDYTISDRFSSRFRVEADQTANTSDGKVGVFVKDAYLKWKDIFNGSDFIFGFQPTPAYEISEAVWGNRSLEKTIMDLRGTVSSRDLAVALKGKFDEEGMFKYWVMIGNGTGNRPETDKYKRYYGHIQFTPFKQFTTTLYVDFRARPNIDDPTSTSNPPATISNNDLTYALFLGYSEKDAYAFGVEGFLNQRQNGLINAGAVKNRTALGLSVFGYYNFSKELAVVGRFDNYDPNTDSNFKGDSRNWFLLSLNYKPVDKVTISPNVIIETYESIGGRSIDPSITPRITFYYSFL
jgi:hypothetical protein